MVEVLLLVLPGGKGIRAACLEECRSGVMCCDVVMRGKCLLWEATGRQTLWLWLFGTFFSREWSKRDKKGSVAGRRSVNWSSDRRKQRAAELTLMKNPPLVGEDKRLYLQYHCSQLYKDRGAGQSNQAGKPQNNFSEMTKAEYWSRANPRVKLHRVTYVGRDRMRLPSSSFFLDMKVWRLEVL